MSDAKETTTVQDAEITIQDKVEFLDERLSSKIRTKDVVRKGDDGTEKTITIKQDVKYLDKKNYDKFMKKFHGLTPSVLKTVKEAHDDLVEVIGGVTFNTLIDNEDIDVVKVTVPTTSGRMKAVHKRSVTYPIPKPVQKEGQPTHVTRTSLSVTIQATSQLKTDYLLQLEKKLGITTT